MKKLITLCLVALLCILPLSGCAEQSVSEQIALADAQMEKTLEAAYTDMKLPGSASDAISDYYLYVENGTKMLGKSFSVAVIHIGDSAEDILARPTTEIDFITQMDGKDADLDYAKQVNDAISEAYGTGTAYGDRMSIADATPESMAAIVGSDDPTCCSYWTLDNGHQVLLRYRADTVSSLTIEVCVPNVVAIPSNTAPVS